MRAGPGAVALGWEQLSPCHSPDLLHTSLFGDGAWHRGVLGGPWATAWPLGMEVPLGVLCLHCRCLYDAPWFADAAGPAARRMLTELF